MKVSACSCFLATLLMVFSCANGVLASQTEVPDMPLLFHESFNAGLDRWEFTDDGAWGILEEGDNQVLTLHRQSEYRPPVRSPRNMALIRDLWVSDFVLEARMKSTTRNYNHRDLCVFFGWRSAADFYYVHMAPIADPHANSVFLVKDKPRVSIARERTEGTKWEDDRYHTVRVVRQSHLGRIEVYFDDLDEPVMIAEDKAFDIGRIGFGSFDDTGAFDEIRVWGIREQPYLGDEELLKLFDGLRVADVSDGMDALGLADAGLVAPEIKPLWRDTEEYSHRVVGIAITVRYVPSNRPRQKFLSAEEFHRWEGEWYTKLSPEPFVDQIRSGSIIVIDGSNDGDTGTIGSNNSLSWFSRGARGIVTSGGARDTDEIIAERIPLYLKRIGRGIRPGRNEVESVNQPVEIGGVLVRPGDVVVADGDGVVIVPRKVAGEVARVARAILQNDKAGRRRLYEQLGMPLDKSVQPDQQGSRP